MLHRSTTRVIALGLTLAALALPSAALGQDSGQTTVFLVRHSEKAPSGRDPSLTAQGRERAEALAHVLGEMAIDAVYATQFARTQETADPLAAVHQLPVIVVEAGAEYVNEMASRIRTTHRGHVVVIVSHSNTVPGIIAALGATPVPAIDEDEYDDLFVVTIDAAGAATVLSLRYGELSP